MNHTISDNLKSSTNKSVDVSGTITLNMRMRDCRVSVVFDVEKNLALPVFIAGFIYRSLRGRYFCTAARDCSVQFWSCLYTAIDQRIRQERGEWRSEVSNDVKGRGWKELTYLSSQVNKASSNVRINGTSIQNVKNTSTTQPDSRL